MSHAPLRHLPPPHTPLTRSHLNAVHARPRDNHRRNADSRRFGAAPAASTPAPGAAVAGGPPATDAGFGAGVGAGPAVVPDVRRVAAGQMNDRAWRDARRAGLEQEQERLQDQLMDNEAVLTDILRLERQLCVGPTVRLQARRHRALRALPLRCPAPLCCATAPAVWTGCARLGLARVVLPLPRRLHAHAAFGCGFAIGPAAMHTAQ